VAGQEGWSGMYVNDKRTTDVQWRFLVFDEWMFVHLEMKSKVTQSIAFFSRHFTGDPTVFHESRLKGLLSEYPVDL
jgi:LPS sulfotransferase NodH